MRNRRKKIMSVLLAFTMMLLTACGSANTGNTYQNGSTSATTQRSATSSARGTGSDQSTSEEGRSAASGVLTVSDLTASSIAGDFTNLTVTQAEENADAANFLITDLVDGNGNEGYRLIELKDGSRYLLVPSEVDAAAEKDNILAGIDTQNAPTVLQGPVRNIYLAATSAMSHFARLGAMDSLAFSGTKEDDWYIPEAKQAMEDGNLLYAGRYSAPDYETLVSYKTSLAVESTMILHTPDVKEKLEELGIPVLTDLSSYEDSPLGRLEWIRVYGALTGKETEAENILNEEKNQIASIQSQLPETKTTCAYFSIDSTGQAVVRKSGDYIASMIAMSGGNYVFSDLKTTGTSGGTTTISMEEFYAKAKNADVLIYNASIEGQLKNEKDLTDANPLFKKCKAVQNHQVYMAKPSLYQATDDVAEILREMAEIFDGSLNEDHDVKYFAKVSQ